MKDQGSFRQSRGLDMEKSPGWRCQLPSCPIPPSALQSSLGLRVDGCDSALPSCSLVALAGMLLTEHFFSHPEMAAHLQVEATVSAGVAGRVAVAVLLNPHSLGPAEDKARRQERKTKHGHNYGRY